MALGDNKEFYENTYYSRLRFKNEEGLLLGFSFWKGMLKVNISKFVDNEYKELSVIHLSPMKAKLLADQLKVLKTFDASDTTSVGVDTGTTDVRNLIVVGNYANATVAGQKYVLIGKVTPDGNLIEDNTFVFNADYNFALNFEDLKKMKCSKKFDNDLELDLFITTLEQFYTNMIGAGAYAVIDMQRFDMSKINTKIGLMMDALHIEKPGRGDQSNSYFNKAGAASPQNSNRSRSNSMSIEDLENM